MNGKEAEIKIIPRDICCYHCRQGNHLHCALPRTCRCYRCYAAEIKQEDKR